MVGSSVCCLSTALKLQDKFKATKILDIYLALNFFSSHTLFEMFFKQDRSLSSYLCFRKYGERHPEIISTFNSIQLKKNMGDGVWVVWFVGVCCFVFYTLGICFCILCSHVRDYQITKSQHQWLHGGRRRIIHNQSFVTNI